MGLIASSEEAKREQNKNIQISKRFLMRMVALHFTYNFFKVRIVILQCISQRVTTNSIRKARSMLFFTAFIINSIYSHRCVDPKYD